MASLTPFLLAAAGTGRWQCVLYPPEKNQHITVLRKNRVFSVPVFPPGGSKPYTTAQIDQCVFPGAKSGHKRGQG